MITHDLREQHFADAPAGYFDYAAVGCVPREVTSAVAGVASALERGLTGSAAWHEYTDSALDLLADDLGVDSGQLSVLANTGTAIASVARAIDFAPGDEVLTTGDDFPNIRLGWLNTPATVREVVVGAEATRTDEIIAAIRSQTRVVAVTHVHATTGTTLDLERLHRATQNAGALLVVDGAQAAGVVPSAAIHSDVYVAAAYKWLLAGFGGAVVATSPVFDSAASPGLVGYMNLPPSQSLAVGHDPLFTLAALAAAARVRQAIGLQTIAAYTTEIVGQISIAAAGLGYATVTADPAGILSLQTSDAPAVVAALRERGITTAFRGSHLRISPYVATTSNDVDQLLTALEDLAPMFAVGAQA